MKKKLFLTILSATLFISLSACSDKSKNSASNSKSSDSTEQTSSTDSTDVSDTSSNSSEKEEKPNSISDIAKIAQANVDERIKQDDALSETYSDIKISYEGDDTLVTTYTYKDELPDDQYSSMKDALETNAKDQLIAATKTDAVQYESIIPDYKAKYVYTKPNGSIIYELLVTKSDYNE